MSAKSKPRRAKAPKSASKQRIAAVADAAPVPVLSLESVLERVARSAPGEEAA